MIKTMMNYFDKDELDLKKRLSIINDGALAMVGREKRTSSPLEQQWKM